MRITILTACTIAWFTLRLSQINGEAQLTPVDFGQTVNGFQDDFARAVRDPWWVAVPAERDAYMPTNGVLKVHTLPGDPNHLLYAAAGYDAAAQEVLARIKVTAFGLGDPHNSGGDCRAGIGVGVNTNSQGINLLFRDADHAPIRGRQFKLLDDHRAWGPPGWVMNWENNSWYWLRLRQTQSSSARGENITGKIWLADGTIPEPADWQIRWRREDRTGLAGITASSGGALAEFEVDYILIKAQGLPSIKAGPSLIILKDPADVTARLGQPVTLRVTAAGFSPPAYQWQKAKPGATYFVDIKGATGSDYTTDSLAAAASGSKYRCRVSIPGTRIVSEEAIVTLDWVAPALVSAKALGNPNQITVVFSEPVMGPACSANFTVDPDIRITGVGCGPDPKTLELATTALTLGKAYTLTVNEIQDYFGNEILPHSQIPIDCDEKVISRLRLDEGHPWRPPFGLERIGRPLRAVVDIVGEYRPLKREYWLAGYSNGKEIERRVLTLNESNPAASEIKTDLFHFSPAHNSLITSGLNNHAPASSDTLQTLDTLGRSKPMTLQRWVWLIGMTDAADERLLEWAHSFTQPPSLELKGARLDFDAYVPERRAIRLIPEDKVMTITIKPGVRCLNPVFEFITEPQTLVSVTLAAHPISPKEYAWDGQTLWLNATIHELTQLKLEFGSRPNKPQPPGANIRP